MATAGGLEIHEQLGHTKDARVAAFTGLAPAAAPVVVTGVSAARVEDVAPIVRPRKGSRTRPAVPALAFAIVVLMLAGIGSAVLRGNKTPLALVQSAGAATSDAKTAKMSVTIKSASGELANGVTVDGAFDFENRRGLMLMDPTQFGAPAVGKVEILFDYSSGLVMYMKFPPEMARRLGNKPWIKMDLAALAQQSGGVDLGSLTQGQSNDPTSGLELLQGADRVDKFGTEQIRGVDTTHYHVLVDVQKALANAPADLREQMSQMERLVHGGPMAADVWIDGDNHVRRFEMVIDGSAFGAPGSTANPLAGQITISYELYDFGAPVDTAIPPADQVADFQDILKRAS